MYDIIIIGAGPAGLTAALYALRAGKTVLIAESASFGGQIVYSNKVENYPAVKQISGMQFADTLTEQVIEQGAEISVEHINGIKNNGSYFSVLYNKGEYECKAVIIATGVKHRTLGLNGEQQLIGNGISFCAVCDGAFYKNADVAVVGGGNTAVQDALYLAENCKKVYLIHRRDTFRAEQKLCEQLKAKNNIELVLNSQISAVCGDEYLTAIQVKDNENNERTLNVECLFEAVGQIACNNIFNNVITLSEDGYILAGEDCKTSCSGIFAAGDCRVKTVRQLTTAAADGAVAAVNACEYINS